MLNNGLVIVMCDKLLVILCILLFDLCFHKYCNNAYIINVIPNDFQIRLVDYTVLSIQINLVYSG